MSVKKAISNLKVLNEQVSTNVKGLGQRELLVAVRDILLFWRKMLRAQLRPQQGHATVPVFESSCRTLVENAASKGTGF